MARAQLTDPLLTNAFHVVDVSLTFPPVLLPIFGFSRVTLPTLNLEQMEITEGNYEFPTKVIKKASVTNVTLEQGVQLVNSDFYDWIKKAVTGQARPRNLLIIQFHRANPKALVGGFVGQALAFASTGGLNQLNRLSSSRFPFEIAEKIPGRAWILNDCKPASYRPGSDLDAMGSEVSIASLELSMREFEEISFGI
jgi:phage tail-like protein